MKTTSQTIREANALWDTLGHAQDGPVRCDAAGNVTHVCASTAVMSVPNGNRPGAFTALTQAMRGIFPTNFSKDNPLEVVRAKFVEAANAAEAQGD